MTCYENLPAEDADRAPVAPMASHIAKWWRSKFRGGYKKFLAHESERTDTEELLGRAPSQCSAPPDLLPSDVRARLQPEPRSDVPPLHASPPSPSPPSKLRYEELTCDVRVRGDTAAEGQPLQFSFTLYDFDGHGRITKDDIAGIVSTIYESVGKRVKVPHYGSKTIQVRLSVSPEQRTEPNDRTAPGDRTTTNERISSGDKMTIASNERTAAAAAAAAPDERTVNASPTAPAPVVEPVATHATAAAVAFPHCERCAARARRSSSSRRDGRRKPRRRRSRCTAAAVAAAAADLSDRAADVSEQEDEAESRRSRQSRLSIDDDDVSDWSGAAAAPRRRFAAPRPPAVAGPRHRRTQHKKRSGSLQRQELLQIIQANMEKNHLTFQTSRKPDENPAANEDMNPNNVKRYRHRNRSFTVSDKPPADSHHKRRSKRPDNGYLDLASPSVEMEEGGIGGGGGRGDGGGNLCRYDRHLHAVICSSARHASAGLHAAPARTDANPRAHPHTTHTPHSPRTPHNTHSRPPYKRLEPRVLQIIFL